MRLAAQARGGFYPASQEAVAHAASFLQRPAGEGFTILDPCAGRGEALHHFRDLLACSPNQVYAIELDDSRADDVHQELPDAQILAPADFFGCRASMNSFSLVWLNPPFDDSYGGHRVEERFLWRATDWLMPGGVMALICPEDVADEYSDVRRYFMAHYERCKIVPFPERHRPFREVTVFGHKRQKPHVDLQKSGGLSWESVEAPEDFEYRIPPGNGPRFFQKIEPTESELQRMLAGSPLCSYLKSPPETPLPSPPLALGIGHVALLLASGHLNGIVQPEGKLPHVVRGTSRKHSFVSDVTDTENDDGSTTTRTTITERIDLVVRTVDLDGQIKTFSESDAKSD